MGKGTNLFAMLITSLIVSVIVSAGVLYIAIPVVYPSNVNNDSSQSKGPMFYNLSYIDSIILNGYSSFDYLNELDLTYSAQAGDRVLIEFNCEITLNPLSTIHLYLRFDINGSIFPSSRIHVSTASDLTTTGYMRHYIDPSPATGNYTVNIYADISEEYTGNYLRYCFVTVTVY